MLNNPFYSLKLSVKYNYLDLIICIFIKRSNKILKLQYF